jgi:hypothetical protein
VIREKGGGHALGQGYERFGRMPGRRERLSQFGRESCLARPSLITAEAGEQQPPPTRRSPSGRRLLAFPSTGEGAYPCARQGNSLAWTRVIVTPCTSGASPIRSVPIAVGMSAGLPHSAARHASSSRAGTRWPPAGCGTVMPTGSAWLISGVSGGASHTCATVEAARTQAPLSFLLKIAIAASSGAVSSSWVARVRPELTGSRRSRRTSGEHDIAGGHLPRLARGRDGHLGGGAQRKDVAAMPQRPAACQ